MGLMVGGGRSGLQFCKMANFDISGNDSTFGIPSFPLFLHITEYNTHRFSCNDYEDITYAAVKGC
jgi:hypothetical protein